MILVVAHLVNIVLELLFVYGFGWGIEGSAWGTAIAQSCMGAGFVWLIVRHVGRDDLAPMQDCAIAVPQAEPSIPQSKP